MANYLLEKQLPDQAIEQAAYYSRTPGAAEAVAAGYGCMALARADLAPEVSEMLGVKAGAVLTAEQLTNVLYGARADGQPIIRSGEAEHAFIDFTFSAPKSVSVAWAFAPTEAERSSILQAHTTARDETLRYIEEQAIRGRLGAGGSKGVEKARAAWFTLNHYTARPTVEIVRPDPESGELYTELHTLKVAADPQLHSHCILPTAVVTESGRVVSLSSAELRGRVLEFGAVYQALLARELRTMNVEVVRDGRTHMASLPAIPARVVAEFSKRNRDAQRAAQSYATEHGLDWKAMNPDQQVALLTHGAHTTRRDKETLSPDMESWKVQAERMGWQHATAVSSTPLEPVRPQTERMESASASGMPFLSAALVKKAVIGQGDARLAAARGFITEGLEHTDELGLMMRHWATHGVKQDGYQTRLLHQNTDQGIRMTTELHRNSELALIRLARTAMDDKRHALSPKEITKAVGGRGWSYDDEHGATQLKATETLGTGGALSVLIGVAGSGKTTRVLPPLVDAWKERGYKIWGVSQAWKQANELQNSGIDRFNTRALAPFIEAVQAKRTVVGPKSVVVLDEVGQIGTRQLLQLLKLREQHGFKLVAMGDDRQCSAIEAGPVIDLLRRAMGSNQIPEILTTVRQASEHERDLAGLLRDGKAAEVLDIKRRDGSAELVPGGRRDAIERVADLYVARREANKADPKYRLTVSAPTNLDARAISVAIRERRQAMGEVGANRVSRPATDGRSDSYVMQLAVGDNVRLYARTRGLFSDDSGHKKSAFVGDNGSVLRIEEILPKDGLMLRGESGKVAFVSWDTLSAGGDGRRLLLGYGDCLTVDSSQGITSDEHINAVPSGSSSLPGNKAYVAGSRHRLRSFLIGSMGVEMAEARARRPLGMAELTPDEAMASGWANLAFNLSRKSVKESALAFLEKAAARRQGSTKGFQASRRIHETRTAAGQNVTTVHRQRQSQQIREKAPALVEQLESVARQQAEAVQAVRDARRSTRDAASRPTPKQEMPEMSESEAMTEFSHALRQAGLKVQGAPVMDGKLHRVAVDGDRGRKTSGTYIGHLDGLPAGYINNFKTGETQNWRAARPVRAGSTADRARDQAERAAQQAARDAERQTQERAAAAKAEGMWTRAKPATAQHPYLQRKGVQPHAMRQDRRGNLVLPMRDLDAKMWGVQTISAAGTKLFLKGGRKQGTYSVIGDLQPGQPFVLVEGYATGATMREATGFPVVVAFDAGNLGVVAQAFHDRDPTQKILVAADNDHRKEAETDVNGLPKVNVGRVKGEATAEAVSGVLLLPPFVPTDNGSDWNDFASLKGLAEVRRTVGDTLLARDITMPPAPVAAGPTQANRDASRQQAQGSSPRPSQDAVRRQQSTPSTPEHSS